MSAETVEGTPAQRQRKLDAVDSALAKATKQNVDAVTTDTVGPSWGKQISEKARNALIVFLVAIMLYITIRFEWKMALATVAALIHDILVVIGVYALFGFPVTPETVVAILTILGFSIYDGIVVFDRIDENAKQLTSRSGESYDDMANRSLNQVLMRSLNTSITALLPILSILDRRRLGPRRRDAAGLRPRPLHRRAVRCLLVAVHRHADPGAAEGPRAPLPRRCASRSPRACPRSRPRVRLRRSPVAGAGAPAGDGGTAADDRPAVPAASGATATRTYSAAHPPRPRKKGKKR